MPPPTVGGDLVLANATVPDAALGVPGGGVRRLDIELAGGRIAALRPAGSQPVGGPAHDLDGGLVLPAFVDLHTHLDKGHIWPRRPNPDGTWLGALNAVMADAGNWSAPDMERRMDFALRCAYAHGTAAIRTHLDSAPPQHHIVWALFERMRERWAGRIELQAVALLGPDALLDPATLADVASVAKSAGGILGGSVGVHKEARRALFAVVEAAGRHGLDLDLHCDETGDPEAGALRHLADAVIETGFRGRVVAGHCCVLAAQDDSTAAETIARTAKAGIAVVSLPMCNLYLQDRRPAGPLRTPRWRGVTLVHELRAAGVPVAFASDNTRDPFYAYGDLDMVEVLREGARIAHLDHPAGEAFGWAASIGAVPARVAGFAYQGLLAEGAGADLVLFSARSWTELLARPQADRTVLRAGRVVDRTLPDYRELDDLMEPAHGP